MHPLTLLLPAGLCAAMAFAAALEMLADGRHGVALTLRDVAFYGTVFIAQTLAAGFALAPVLIWIGGPA